MPNLTVKKVQTLKKPGMYGDGEGLYLRVGPTGAKSWILRGRIKGRATRHEFGLGSVTQLGLAEARDKAREWRRMAKSGKDPRREFKREELTFRDAARRVHSNLSQTWKNQKHRDTWLSTVENYANPSIGDVPIGDVGTADVLSVISPIWVEKHETAKRLKQRLSTIFDWAKGAGHYPYENPVNGIKKALPNYNPKAVHLSALDWKDVPAFVAELRKREGISARTLEFIILTAVRSGEARGARWSEIKNGIWTVPAERMKRNSAHRVPLSSQALDVLESVRGLDAEYVFPSNRLDEKGHARPQSVMVFKSLMKRMGRDGFTVHGFRSSFRDWCTDYARAPREVAEASLSHAVGDGTERSYARSDMLERRQELMDRWADYVDGKSGQIVRMIG